MLALTENVTTLVNKLTAEDPELSGLRIAVEPDGQSLSVSPASEPQPDDQTIEQDGANVYLDASAAELLDDKVLDSGVDQEGNIQFGLAQQA